MNLTTRSSQPTTPCAVALVINCLTNDGNNASGTQHLTSWYNQLDAAVQASRSPSPITILTVPVWMHQNSQPERNVIAFDGSRRIAFIAMEHHENREQILHSLAASATRNASFNIVLLTRLDDQTTWQNTLTRSAAIVRAHGPGGYSRAQVGHAVYDLPRTNARNVDRLSLWCETNDFHPNSRVPLPTSQENANNATTNLTPPNHQQGQAKTQQSYSSSAFVPSAQQKIDNTSAQVTSSSQPYHQQQVQVPRETAYSNPALGRTVQLAALRAQVVVLTEHKLQLEKQMREREQHHDSLQSDIEALRSEINQLHAQIVQNSLHIERLEQEG